MYLRDCLSRSRRRVEETPRTPEQTNHTDDEKSQVMWYESEVDDLSRDEDSPIAKESGNVCLFISEERTPRDQGSALQKIK